MNKSGELGCVYHSRRQWQVEHDCKHLGHPDTNMPFVKTSHHYIQKGLSKSQNRQTIVDLIDNIIVNGFH